MRTLYIIVRPTKTIFNHRCYLRINFLRPQEVKIKQFGNLINYCMSYLTDINEKPHTL